jgi:hypothetical protein
VWLGCTIYFIYFFQDSFIHLYKVLLLQIKFLEKKYQSIEQMFLGDFFCFCLKSYQLIFCFGLVSYQLFSTDITNSLSEFID